MYLYCKASQLYCMQLDFNPALNEKLYLRNPQLTEIGRKLIKNSIKLIYSIGYEQFTFKKLAVETETTEATIYRYFTNKHKLLIYLVDYYWAFLEFLVVFKLNNLNDPAQKIKKIIDILVWEDNEEVNFGVYDHKALYYITIAEGSKTYLSKEVDEYNKDLFFKPFKDLSSRIGLVFLEYNPTFKFPNSLASSLIEISHLQYFFMHHLPRLSDFSTSKNPKDLEAFLENLVFSSLSVNDLPTMKLNERHSSRSK